MKKLFLFYLLIASITAKSQDSLLFSGSKVIMSKSGQRDISALKSFRYTQKFGSRYEIQNDGKVIFDGLITSVYFTGATTTLAKIAILNQKVDESNSSGGTTIINTNNIASKGRQDSLITEVVSNGAKIDGVNTTLGTLFKTGQSIGNTGFNVNNQISGYALEATNISNGTKLTAINTTLGTPFQAGGSIGNTGFNVNNQISGYALEATNVSNGTKLTAINTTLGTPFQAGGSIGNTGFNVNNQISGYALETTNTGNGTKLTAINTTLGTPFQAGGSIGNTGFNVNNQISGYALETTNTSNGTKLTTINTTLGTPFQAGGSIGNAFNLEATQQLIYTRLGLINGKDYATETSLANFSAKFGSSLDIGNVGLKTGSKVGIDIANNTVTLGVNSGSVTQVNSSITAGGTAQIALSSNTSRTGFEIINNSSAVLYINLSGSASASTLAIPVGASYSRYTGKIPTNAVSIFGGTTGQSFTVIESN